MHPKETVLGGETYLLYIDESMEGNDVVIAALAIPASCWSKSLDQLIAIRRLVRHKFGIFISKEIHASEFLGGRGRYSKTRIKKPGRAAIFEVMLREFAKLEGLRLFTVHCDHKMMDWGFERLMNRVQRQIEGKGGTFLIVADIGFEWLYTPKARKMRRYNPIPNRYGGGYKNVPLMRLVEDPVFLDSKRSYFIQAADAIAYALLRYVRPKPDDPYGINDMFKTHLSNACVKEASEHSLGLIRVH